jgi:hypothetical protein
MDVETHPAVFQWVLAVLAENKLLKGMTIGVDATTLEANAALRSIVRRDSGERYEAKGLQSRSQAMISAANVSTYLFSMAAPLIRRFRDSTAPFKATQLILAAL